MENKFYKVGRIYWINPKPIPGYPSKVRPGIVLEKYDNGKTIIIQLGSTTPGHPLSIRATNKLYKSLGVETFRPDREVDETFVWLDPSKPEWNTSIIKPHFKDGKYIDINHQVMKKIRALYHKRKNELSNSRINRAKGFIYLGEIDKAKKQLQMFIDKDPNKNKNMDIDQFIKNIRNKM